MVHSVSQWLNALGLGEFNAIFDAEQVRLDDLPHLTETDLKDLGIPLGPRKRILNAIAQHSVKSVSQEIAESNFASDATPKVDAERRQLTVLFCDLVGSTELAQSMDPEDLRHLTRAYQETCTKVIERYEGFIARYMGDGIMAYFGYPLAHEEDAVRALYAGLGIVEALTEAGQSLQRPDGVELEVRIGVATGYVVVGDLIGKGISLERDVVGETPNLAARLQGLAEPNTVIISESTHSLAAGLFEYEDLGKFQIKGFTDSIHVWRVLSRAKVESHYEALRKAGITRLVGREVEVALLADRWNQTKEGEGQVVLLSGEAGIGKSRITQSLIESTAEDEPIRLRFQCSPFHTNTALYPVIERLEKNAGIQTTDPADVKLDKLESMLVPTSDSVETIAPLFAALLSIHAQNRYPLSSFSSELRKEKTLEALVSQAQVLSQDQPVLIVFEDIHWIDPTSFEFLELLVENVQNSKVLVIATFRTEFTIPWTAYTHITALTLNRFSHSMVTAMIKEVTGGKSLSDELVKAIAQKTDGVPLFVEEFTKTILESDLLMEEANQFVFSGQLEHFAVPVTLHDSLMARLDRLGKVKEVAQYASAIGREFDYDLLAAISPLGARNLQNSLDQLVNAELIFQTRRTSRGNYVFKHALVQDAAYGSLLKSTRQEIHRSIAVALEERFSGTTANNPEMLAHHYTEARMASEATRYWFEAGNRATERSANLEAVAHFKKGLEVVQSQPQTDEWLAWEMDLQLALTVVLTATAGYAADETAATCLRAQELCKQLGDVAKLFRALYSVWCMYYMRPDQGKALELAEEFKHLAETGQDRVQLVAAYSTVGQTFAILGCYPKAHRFLKKSIEFYTPEQDHSLALLYGEHPGVGSKIVCATVDWMIGCPDLAVKHATESLAEAQEISDPNTIGWAWVSMAMLHKDRQDNAMTVKSTNDAISFAKEQSLPYWRSMALPLLAWALVDRGDVEAGMELVHESLEAVRATGSGVRVPDTLSVLALGYLNTHQPDKGLTEIQKAIRVIEETGERWNKANMHCLKGQLLYSMSSFDDAEISFLDAIRIAKLQGANSYELRASTHLARLWYSQNKIEQAAKLMLPIYSQFTEGFDTRDLKEARSLLDLLT